MRVCVSVCLCVYVCFGVFVVVCGKMLFFLFWLHSHIDHVKINALVPIC